MMGKWMRSTDDEIHSIRARILRKLLPWDDSDAIRHTNYCISITNNDLWDSDSVEQNHLDDKVDARLGNDASHRSFYYFLDLHT